MKRFTYAFCILFLLAFNLKAQQLSLAGKWMVKLDSFENKSYPIHLPGTLDDAGIGYPVNLDPKLDNITLAHLSRKVEFIGKAHYTKIFTVPGDWKQKQITLKLGRVIWQSEVTIDGQNVIGVGESLVSSHEFDVTNYIKPGKAQTITISIDNRDFYPGINVESSNYVIKESRELAHSYTNHTQIKWNGLLGEITLIARPITQISEANIFADFDNKEIAINYRIKNELSVKANLFAYITDLSRNKKWPIIINRNIIGDILKVNIPFRKDVKYWGEFDPALYQLTTILKSKNGNDTSRINFGVRNLSVQDANLQLNGNRIFIRGNLECVIFPLTGYPPMKEKEWSDLFTKAKSYGLNAFRFHSWCPPEAAFAAADKSGFYLQVELPHWNLHVGKDMQAFNFLEREAHRILHEYGNHPSFLFFSMGNELEGDFSKLNQLVASLKKIDNRHLYSTTTFTFQKGITGKPQPQDDFYVTQWTQKGWVRGQGVFNDKAPDFSTDYSKNADSLDVPIISHEIGQYSVYPDMKEIAEYKGNLRPLNFIAVKNDLTKKGLMPLANKYLQASGKFAAILYKEEIERALKTKEFDGFELLQLQDFPGQGTALVGLLNAFWGSKGILTPSEFHEYCSDVTPLIRFPKAVYKNNEIFEATVELSNFYKPLRNISLSYSITNTQGETLQTGIFEKNDFAVDNVLVVGKIDFNLQKIIASQKLTITVKVDGTSYRNDWNIWVYPEQLPSLANKILVRVI